MSKTFEFYRKQIVRGNYTEAELNALFEEIAYNDKLTHKEYCELYELVMNKLRRQF